jgi:tripartite-type tricarboxylate transporter receptor subunit TctC
LRNLVVAGSVALVAVSIAAGSACGQEAYPARPVQVIVGFQPGGSVDVMARHLLTAMSARLGQPFVVLNRDGASGSVGFGQLAAARPDGYTLGAGPTTPIATAPHLMKDIKYGVDSFEYICQTFENVFTVSVRPESPFRSIDDIIAAARTNPGKLSYGHSGNGTVPHLSVSNLVYRLNLNVVSIAYRGETAALPDVIAGRLDFGAPSVAVVVGQKLRVLAVFADRRHPSFPDAPTFAELGMPSMPAGLNGLFAPKGTPPEILALLERSCEQATQSESFRAGAERMHQPVIYLGRAAFAERARTDYRYKGELIRLLGIKAE